MAEGFTPAERTQSVDKAQRTETCRSVTGVARSQAQREAQREANVKQESSEEEGKVKHRLALQVQSDKATAVTLITEENALGRRKTLEEAVERLEKANNLGKLGEYIEVEIQVASQLEKKWLLERWRKARATSGWSDLPKGRKRKKNKHGEPPFDR